MFLSLVTLLPANNAKAIMANPFFSFCVIHTTTQNTIPSTGVILGALMQITHTSALSGEKLPTTTHNKVVLTACQSIAGIINKLPDGKLASSGDYYSNG